MILQVPSYIDPVEARLFEAVECLERNARLPWIESIYVFVEDPIDQYKTALLKCGNQAIAALSKGLADPKVTLVERGKRITHKSMIQYANAHFLGKTVIYANVDVHFDETLALLDGVDLRGLFLCMAKYNGPNLHMPSLSQDAWIFTTKVPDFAEEWMFGPAGNDNRVAYEAQKAGLRVFNPSLSVKVHHLHTSAVRRHTEAERYHGHYLPVDACTVDRLPRKDWKPIITISDLSKIAENIKNNPDPRPAWLQKFHEDSYEETLYYRFLYELSVRLRPRVVLETGTRFGCSAAQFAAGCPDTKVITVDLDPECPTRIAQNPQTKQLTNILSIACDSSKAFNLIINHAREVDILFLDSEHTYNVVSSEYRLYCPLVKNGGLILLDDIHFNEEIERFWEQVPPPKIELPYLHLVRHTQWHREKGGVGFGVSLKMPS